jgi:hypothetical protein
MIYLVRLAPTNLVALDHTSLHQYSSLRIFSLSPNSDSFRKIQPIRGLSGGFAVGLVLPAKPSCDWPDRRSQTTWQPFAFPTPTTANDHRPNLPLVFAIPLTEAVFAS